LLLIALICILDKTNWIDICEGDVVTVHWFHAICEGEVVTV